MGYVKFIDDYWQWSFDQGGQNPKGWWYHAKDLLAAAEAVKEKVPDVGENTMPSLVSVQAMLVGMSLESTLQGLWVKGSGHSLTEDGEYRRPETVGSHDLVDWAVAASIKLSSDQRHLLKRLSSFVKWAGRYPIPLKIVHMKPYKEKDNDDFVIRDFILPRELAVAEALCRRLLDQLRPENWSVSS